MSCVLFIYFILLCYHPVQVHFLVESTAAATAYGLSVAGVKNVLIFDMGGGTTDLTIMHVNDGMLSVQCTGGNNSLGGNNIDACLLDLVFEKATSLPGMQLLLETRKMFR